MDIIYVWALATALCGIVSVALILVALIMGA